MRTQVIKNQNDETNSQLPKSVIVTDSTAKGIAFGTATPVVGSIVFNGYTYIYLQPLVNLTVNKDIVIPTSYSGGFPLAGIVLQSPNGTLFRIGVLDTGEVWSSQV
jgi:hypothetical protein